MIGTRPLRKLILLRHIRAHIAARAPKGEARTPLKLGDFFPSGSQSGARTRTGLTTEPRSLNRTELEFDSWEQAGLRSGHARPSVAEPELEGGSLPVPEVQISHGWQQVLIQTWREHQWCRGVGSTPLCCWPCCWWGCAQAQTRAAPRTAAGASTRSRTASARTPSSYRRQGALRGAPAGTHPPRATPTPCRGTPRPLTRTCPVRRSSSWRASWRTTRSGCTRWGGKGGGPRGPHTTPSSP